jgi:hypothetical protein
MYKIELKRDDFFACAFGGECLYYNGGDGQGGNVQLIYPSTHHGDSWIARAYIPTRLPQGMWYWGTLAEIHYWLRYQGIESNVWWLQSDHSIQGVLYMNHVEMERDIYYDKQNVACFAYFGTYAGVRVIIWQRPDAYDARWFVSVDQPGKANAQSWGTIAEIVTWLEQQGINVVGNVRKGV